MNKGKIKLVLTFLLVVLAISITAACSKPTVNKTYKGYEEFLILHDETIPLAELDSIGSIELEISTESNQVDYRLTDDKGILFYHLAGEIASTTTFDEWEHITVNGTIDLMYGTALDEDNIIEVTAYILRDKDTAYITHPDVGDLDVIIKMSETGEPLKEPQSMERIHELLYSVKSNEG